MHMCHFSHAFAINVNLIYIFIEFVFFSSRIIKPLNMVEKWKLCIEVSCYPNLGKAVITYVLSNIATSKVVQRKMNIPGRTTNNEAYYIGLIEGLGTTMEYGSIGIVVFTNSELVCNQMNGVCQVKKERLK